MWVGAGIPGYVILLRRLGPRNARARAENTRPQAFATMLDSLGRHAKGYGFSSASGLGAISFGAQFRNTTAEIGRVPHRRSVHSAEIGSGRGRGRCRRRRPGRMCLPEQGLDMMGHRETTGFWSRRRMSLIEVTDQPPSVPFGGAARVRTAAECTQVTHSCRPTPAGVSAAVEPHSRAVRSQRASDRTDLGAETRPISTRK